jgi:hypothetical protein
LLIVHIRAEVTILIGCDVAGGLVGGFVGDAAAARYPNHGRIAVTQFSVFAGVPLSLILMKVGIIA